MWQIEQPYKGLVVLYRLIDREVSSGCIMNQGWKEGSESRDCQNSRYARAQSTCRVTAATAPGGRGRWCSAHGLTFVGYHQGKG